MKTLTIGIVLLMSHFAHSNDQVIGFVRLNICSNTIRDNAIDQKHTRDTLTIHFTTHKNSFSLSYTYESNSTNMRCLSQNIEWLNPMCLTHDTINGEFYYHFKCLKVENGNYEVILNETTKQTAWISDSGHLTFFDFKKDLTKNRFFFAFCLSSSSRVELHRNRKTNAPIALIEPIDLPCYQIIRRRKDWVKIKISRNTSCSNPFSPTGWIKLFNDGTLHHNLTCR